TNLPKTSSVALVKTAVYNGNATAAQVGDTITYTFTITNTGNTTLSNAVVSDAKLGMTNVAVSPSTLAPNASGTLTQNYTITQADINAGTVTNSAIGSATDPSNVTVSDTSGTTTTNDTPTVTTVPSAPSTSSVALVKTAVYNGNATAAQVGDTITYTFTITNTGNTTLSNAVVSDAKLGMTNVAVSPSTLAPNASGTLTQNYTITQADIDAGHVVNSALATGRTPQNVLVQDTSGTSITNDTPTTTILNSVSSINLLKEGVYEDSNNDGIVNIGDRINYTFTVQNTGQTTLSNVIVSDPNVTVVGQAIPTLAVNAINSTNFSASYLITQSDISAGVVYNLATVSATNQQGMTVTATSTDPTPCVTCPVSPTCLTCTITELPINNCAVEVFNAVSPNTGDDFERILYIKGIECYPNNTVQVFDRWGVKVFDIAGYNNTTKAFRGMSEGRVTVQQTSGLPTGTYFYVIDYTNFTGEKIEKTGYLHLEND
ncbi:gliding motility-associated C-terminal domain-containing protein, partial [Flavobacterium sp. F-328]